MSHDPGAIRLYSGQRVSLLWPQDGLHLGRGVDLEPFRRVRADPLHGHELRRAERDQADGQAADDDLLFAE